MILSRIKAKCFCFSIFHFLLLAFMLFLIDGYNLLWSAHTSDEDAQSLTDLDLCRLVSDYIRIKKAKGQIVFDGIGPPDKKIFDSITSLEVIFTGKASDADTVIINKIRTYSAPKHLTVITSDRKIRDAASVKKVILVKSEEFLEQMLKQLSRRKRPVEPAAKRRGISDAETEHWLKVFGFKK